MDVCIVCKGELWVCENHPYKPFNETGCTCGAGNPCECNQGPGMPRLPPGFEVFSTTQDTPEGGE